MAEGSICLRRNSGSAAGVATRLLFRYMPCMTYTLSMRALRAGAKLGTVLSCTLSLGSCLLLENKVSKIEKSTKTCAAPASRADGEGCHCDQDCKSDATGGFCYSEADYAYPHGYCYGECKLDNDCGEHAACQGGRCRPRCAANVDCGAGQSCWSVRDDKLTVCFPFCDENTDCESGNCNIYSNTCLASAEEPTGAGLNAECAENGECRSNYCVKGKCQTGCDVEAPHCPEGGMCVKKVCVNASLDGGADDDAGVVCD
jgi:hypothetical protein